MTSSIFDLTDKMLAVVVAGLLQSHAGKDGITETLTRLNAQNCTHRNTPIAAANSDPACRHLGISLAATERIDKNIAAAIADLAPLLHWQRIGPQVPRPPTGIMTDYAFSQIIGPSGVYPGDDFMIGLFIIGPNQYYPEHWHTAPEFYWLFSGPTKWRFAANGAWVQKEADQLQWNKSGDLHGIRTLETPLFALWAWTNDIHGDFEIAGADGKASLLIY